ncbi:hypothetical protein CCHR01_06105 [Colletotrichum chrysophilum]|uniref:Integral membrane protein n=1 Tax=Colletotrichum chrysophilum TaxID=1836956 RepID=A0AAD9EK09_9PEZI|nr:hypothetical protein CCHR01_06105 [Colletotrichum chrysophilum]
MAVGFRFYHSLLGVYLIFIARVQAASDGSNTPDEEMAGWREVPTSRGTLNLVWSCIITIFACTWTVTHLNLPGPNDTAIRKFIRRLKWMSINIMFPEFILSKAICDLRQALDELRQFGQTLPNTPQSQHDANSPTGDHLRSEPSIENAPQKWTISHSYYTQMGGIMIPSDYTSDTVRYEVLTATKLTPQYQWDEDHPLKRLELSEQDIQDKSKAGWLLKSLAILQIVWLVLNVIVRGVTGLAVTQLEIATAAFALMAVLTYLASWWKPKDISEPTYTRHSSTGEWKSTPQMVQPSLWFKSPATAANSEVSKRLHSGERVPNDVAWMGGRTSLMTSFLAVSSLRFGGIHCLAWNFEFPSRTELILWRSACVVAAILPTITLGVSTLLSHLSETRLDRELSQLENGISKTSKVLSITSYMVYSVARLLIMVQLFTSLRSTPADVYEVTPWVNLLPKIS